jgi:chromosome segregation ATPase
MLTEKPEQMTPDLIAYRLDNIEIKLADMQKLIEGNILQDKDIKDLQSKMSKAETEISAMKKEIETIKQEPIKKSAKRWEYVIDYIFKALVAIGVTAMLIKMGLSK